MKALRTLRKSKGTGNGHGQQLVTRTGGTQTPDLFGRLFGNMGFSFPNWGLTTGFSDWRQPPVDIIDKGNAYELDAELPGVSRAEVEVNVTDDRLEIRAATRHEEAEEEGDYYYREIGSQSFFRAVPLPPDADPDNVDATLENGCLCVTIGKREGGGSGRRTVKVR